MGLDCKNEEEDFEYRLNNNIVMNDEENQISYKAENNVQLSAIEVNQFQKICCCNHRILIVDDNDFNLLLL